MTYNVYLNEVVANLPRLLSLIDKDSTSESYGVADRFYWSWGLIDFGNGTFQGMAHGLSLLWKNQLWPYKTTKKKFIDRIDLLFIGTKKLMRNNGSLEESFPNEGSYCVTALVSFDLLCTLELLKNDIDEQTKKKWLDTIKPLINYLLRREETHAIISNHLATAIAAILRWNDFHYSDKTESHARALFNKMIKHQSSEGWYSEYGGPDPGYQTLCTHYLADIFNLRPNWEFNESIKKSLLFLSYFVHPDGSFGGLYGSRYTRFFYPSGILSFSSSFPEASVISDFMENSIKNKKVVTLSSIDEPNLIPTFNSYCLAAVVKQREVKRKIKKISKKLPFQGPVEQKFFRQSGIFIDKGKNHYTIVAGHKGGLSYHFKDKNKLVIMPGAVVKDKEGRLGSNHNVGSVSISKCKKILTINSPVTQMPKQLMRPWQFILLRVLAISFFRIFFFREITKKILVNKLIDQNKYWSAEVKTTIHLGRELYIHRELTKENKSFGLIEKKYFVPIHMASQGYWQIQDEDE